ncbi:sodium/glutamate symporter, partial [Staphylococcus hominis]
MLKLDPIITLAIASLLYLLGVYIINHVSILKKLCIPAPVIGGLLFSVLVAILDSTHIL